MDKQITISTGTFVRAIVVGAVAYALWILRDIALLVITAIVLASAIEPGVLALMKYRLPRVLAVLAMYLAVFGSLFGIVYFLFPPLIDDAQNVIASLPQYVDTLNIPGVDPTLFSSTGHEGDSLIDTLLTFRTAFTDTSGAFGVVAAFFGGIFSLILVLVLSFYFALQERGVEDFLRVVVPAKHENYVVGLWKRAQKKIGLWMQGQLILSLIVGTIVYLGLLILGVPYALLLAILAAVFDLIPIFGSPFAGILGVIVAFSAGGVTLALIVAGLYFIVNQFEAHLLYPLVVNKVVGVPPLLVILALIAGGTLAGFLGVLLSVPFAAALREFIDDLDKGKRVRSSAA